MNYAKGFNLDKFYNLIENKVSTKLNRRLEILESNEIKTFIKNIDAKLLKSTALNNTVEIMVSTLVDEFSKTICVPVEDISRNYLLNAIGIQGDNDTSYSISSNPAVSKPSSQSSSQLITQQNIVELSKQKNYILLDSRYSTPTVNTDGITIFNWSYNKNPDIKDGFCILGNTGKITAMRICPFRIPYNTIADNKYSRISILLNNFASQSYVGHENCKFHFMAESKIDTNFIDLNTDTFNDGHFYFDMPSILDTIQLSLFSPLELIIFDRDRDLCSIDYFSASPFTKITTDNKHNLKNGDIVYFSNFDVMPSNLQNANYINNSVKNSINNADGFLITVIDSTTFYIDYNSSIIQNPIPNIKFDVYYGSKRIFIPIELTYIK